MTADRIIAGALAGLVLVGACEPLPRSGGDTLAPDFATSRALYAVSTVEHDGNLVNRVLRMSDENGKAGPATVIVDGISGCRLPRGWCDRLGSGSTRSPRSQ